AGTLGRYSRLVKGPGLSRAIANILTELRLELLTPDNLDGANADLKPILQAYETELQDHLFTDWPGVLAIAAAAARDRVDELSFLRLPTLLLDMPVTSQAELSLVEALCARAPDCLITIPSADSVTLERVRSSLGTEIVNLERALGDMAITNGSLSR